MRDAFTPLELSLIHLVDVRRTSRLTQRRTWTQQQLKGSSDSSDGIVIRSMCVTPCGDSLVLADYNNSVKELQLSTGSRTEVYKETSGGWKVGAALEVAAGGALHLLLPESKSDNITAKMVLVAHKRDDTNGCFLVTHNITFRDDDSHVCAMRVGSHSLPLTDALSLSISHSLFLLCAVRCSHRTCPPAPAPTNAAPSGLSQAATRPPTFMIRFCFFFLLLGGHILLLDMCSNHSYLSLTMYSSFLSLQ